MKKNIILLGLVIIIILCGSIFVIAGINDNKSELDINKLSKLNIKLDEPTDKSLFSLECENAAIKTAKKETQNLNITDDNIKVKRCLITNPSLQVFSEQSLENNPSLKAKGYMDKLPVYIVTINNVEFHGFGLNSSKSFSQYHIVVDAVSGEVLMSFSYN